MKKSIALLLAGVLTLSGAFGTSIVTYAEETESTEQTTELGQESEEIQTEEISEEAQSDEGAAAVSDSTEEEIPHQTDNANSWRYEDGERIETESDDGLARAGSNAWSKVNGVWVNNYGNAIPGATAKGMDISYAQGTIDWDKVKNESDIDFVIIRCGYGSNYADQDDTQWLNNVTACERLGIPYGVYIYSYAKNTSMASSEADHVIRLLQGHSPQLPVYYDMEENSQAALGNSVLTQLATTWCNKIQAAGYKPGIYANTNWFTHYLTDPVFTNSGWSIWWANYKYECEANCAYDIWQCTSSGRVPGISANTVDLNFWCNSNLPGQSTVTPLKTFTIDDMEKTAVSDENLISTTAHLQSYGWTNESDKIGFASPNGYQCGATGVAKRLEAFKIDSGSVSLKYRAHVQSYGWLDWVSSGHMAGTIGEAKSVQAIAIELTGDSANKYDVYYRVHCQTFGWTGWAKNGDIAGSTGYGKRAEAIQVAVVAKGASAPGSLDGAFYKGENIAYQMHQQTYGWLSTVLDGAEAGITGLGKRGEAVRISLKNPEYSGGITYRVHQQTYGWLDWVSDGEEAGITGMSKRGEAIQIELTGTMAEKYDVYYRTHCQTFGWLDWAKNGEVAGSTGYGKRMEALEVVLVKKGGPAPGETANHCMEQ